MSNKYRLCRLTAESEQYAPTEIIISNKDGKVTVGRQAQVCIDSFLNAASISRCHASLEVNQRTLFVMDTSMNGTLVNGRRIVKGVPYPLTTGKIVTFGDNRDALSFQVVPCIVKLHRQNSTPTPKISPVVQRGKLEFRPSAQLQTPKASVFRRFKEQTQTPSSSEEKSPSAVSVTLSSLSSSSSVVGLDPHSNHLSDVYPTHASVKIRDHWVPISSAAEKNSASQKSTPRDVEQVSIGIQVDPSPPTGGFTQPHHPSQRKNHYSISSNVMLIKDSEKTLLKLSEVNATSFQWQQEAVMTVHAQDAVLLNQECQLSEIFDIRRRHAESILKMLLSNFHRPSKQFHHSTESIQQLKIAIQRLCIDVASLVTLSPLLIQLPSPAFLFGDLHGSFADLLYIFDMTVPFQCTKYMTSHCVFLGDFVDRGPHSLELLAFLMAWKVMNPTMVHILRGNHEDPAINGDILQYGEGSFLSQCRSKLGDVDGSQVWKEVNDVLSLLPIACVVDESVVACHGGISHPELETWWNRLTTQIDFPRFSSLMPADEDAEITAEQRTFVRELLWNDPITESAAVGVDKDGFRPSMVRGDGNGLVFEFSEAALHNFLDRHRFSMLIRAHQQKGHGIQVAHSASLITVFSASDYSLQNAAGACLLLGNKVRLISWHQGSMPLDSSSAPSNNSVSLCLGWRSGRIPRLYSLDLAEEGHPQDDDDADLREEERTPEETPLLCG